MIGREPIAAALGRRPGGFDVGSVRSGVGRRHQLRLRIGWNFIGGNFAEALMEQEITDARQRCAQVVAMALWVSPAFQAESVRADGIAKPGRILFLGDSITWWFNLSYAHLLRKKYKDKCHIDVVAVGG